MHDIRAIRDNPAAFVSGWSSRGVEGAQGLVDEILTLDTALRAAQTAGQTALARRNESSKLIGAAMGKKDLVEAERLKGEVESLKGEIAAAEAEERELHAKLLGPQGLLAAQKSLAADDVPDGEDEAGNVLVGQPWGVPREGGPAKDHADLGEALGLLDFEAAAKMSGSRFAVLKGGLARLERAIGQFMLDVQTGEHGYLEVNPPYLVRDEAMFGTGQLPKFENDLFFASSLVGWTAGDHEYRAVDGAYIKPNAQLRYDAVSGDVMVQSEETVPVERLRYLIPTAEVSLTNLVREQILSEDELATPIRFTALTPCFRAEAGSAGRDTRGLIRQHQFHNVLPQLPHLGRLREHMHPRTDRRMTRRHHPTRPIRFQRHLHRAYPARPIRLQLRRITKRRHMPPTLVPINEIQNRVAHLKPHRFTVKISSKCGKILDHWNEWVGR